MSSPPPHPHYIICHSMCTSFMNPTNLSAIHLSDVNKNQECCVEQVTAEVSCFDWKQTTPLYFIPKDLQKDQKYIYINTEYLHDICIVTQNNFTS